MSKRVDIIRYVGTINYLVAIHLNLRTLYTYILIMNFLHID